MAACATVRLSYPILSDPIRARPTQSIHFNRTCFLSSFIGPLPHELSKPQQPYSPLLSFKDARKATCLSCRSARFKASATFYSSRFQLRSRSPEVPSGRPSDVRGSHFHLDFNPVINQSIDVGSSPSDRIHRSGVAGMSSPVALVRLAVGLCWSRSLQPVTAELHRSQRAQ